MTPERRTLAARSIFPVEGPPITGGCLTIADGRIEWVGPLDGRKPDLDLGNVAILPGLVNAHTHLELDPIESSSPGGEEDEIEWLGRVIEQRRRRTFEELKRTAARNLADCLEAGTTLLADITTGGLSWGPIVRAPVRAVVFAELIGLKPMRTLQNSEEAFDWLTSIRPGAQAHARARPGLSPHAPYSTAGSLYHRAVSSGLPLTTHLAELPEELELLEHRRGRLRQFLEDLGAWDDDWEPIGDRPADYIRRGDLRRADWLIAHGNYLAPEDFWQLRPDAAPADQRVAVAYCPRTHARFGHAPHPYRAMLQRGIVVCLGTDSRASAPSLSVLDEVRFLHRLDPSLGGPLLLTMATLFGAWALRSEAETGSLRPGKSADLAIVSLPDRDADDPHQLLLDSDLPVLATVFEGQFITGPWAIA